MATTDVVIVKFGEEVAPAATVTLAGAPTPGSPLDRFTTKPPAGAGPLSVTLFPVVETPPVAIVGDSVIDSSATGVTVRAAVFVSPLNHAEMVTVLWTATTAVGIGKFGEGGPPARA